MNKKALLGYLDKLMDGNLSEKLSKKELDEVASNLTNPDELYMRITILAKSFDPRFMPLFEKYALFQDDADVSGMALRALIDFHHKTEYLPLLSRFIEGVDWDIIGSLKLHGIHIAEQYLKDKKNMALVDLLIHEFECSEDEIIRQAAHEALMAAGGVDRSDLATEIGGRGLTDSEIRLDVIAKLKAQVKTGLVSMPH